MKACVYDLAVGSDMAVNETEVAKENDDAARMDIVEAAISRVLDQPITEKSTTWPESDCPVLATWKADSTCTIPQGIRNSPNPLESDPVLCRDHVTGNIEDTMLPDLVDMNSTSSPWKASNPARSMYDTTLPDIEESNSASSTSTRWDVVWPVVSDPELSIDLFTWESNGIWMGSGSTKWRELDNSTDLISSDGQEGSSSRCRNSGEGDDSTGNCLGESDQKWCPSLDPVWSPPEAGRTSSNSKVPDDKDKDTTTSEPSDNDRGLSLDPVGSFSDTDHSTTCMDSDAWTDDSAHSSEGSDKAWYPALDPVGLPVRDCGQSDTENDDRTYPAGSNEDFLELDPLVSPTSESIPSPVQETLESDVIVEGSVAYSLSSWTPSDVEEQDGSSAYPGMCGASGEQLTRSTGLGQRRCPRLDSVRLQDVALVCPASSEFVCSPALGVREDKEEEGFVETGTDGTDWTLAVTKWLGWFF